MMLTRKPNVLQDVAPKGANSVFEVPRPNRINLVPPRPPRRNSFVPVLEAAAIAWAAWFLIIGSVTAPTVQSLAAAASAVTDAERQALESQLRDLEGQIDQYENQIVAYQKQGGTLKGEISSLNSKIAKLNLQIKAVELTLTQLDAKIADTQVQIVGTESSITTHRATLTELLKSLHEKDQTSLVAVFLKNPRISDFFGDVTDIELLQTNVRLTIREIQDLQDHLKDQKEQYSLARADAKTLKEYQAAQRKETDVVKQQKNQLLEVTKGQETRYQALLKETEKTAAQIRSRIFQLLGGGELTFEQAYDYAKLASGATGVRAAIILAVLDRESALGKNVGRCSYKTSMSPKNQPLFLQVVAELGLSPDSMLVSCANADGAYGGAMGPAQFIPSTWMLYREKVAAVTGRNPASPWNNADAFVATALYLKDAGAANASVADERKAAARYYAGGNWSRFLWTYGEAVVSRAQRFEKDIAAITGN